MPPSSPSTSATIELLEGPQDLSIHRTAFRSHLASVIVSFWRLSLLLFDGCCRRRFQLNDLTRTKSRDSATGNAAFLNAGAGDFVIVSVSLDLSARLIELPSAKLVRAGEVMSIDIPSQYEKPKDINGATWVRGEAPSSLISEALDIGKP